MSNEELYFCSSGGYDLPGADAECRARAAGVVPRRRGACQTEFHPDGGPEGGARGAGESEHVGAQSGLDGE